MPFLNIVGCTSMNTIIQLALVFLYSKTKNNYIWALIGLQEILGEDVFPIVMVTNQEQALILAVQIVFSIISIIFCKWHIRKNVIKTYKRHFDIKET